MGLVPPLRRVRFMFTETNSIRRRLSVSIRACEFDFRRILYGLFPVWREELHVARAVAIEAQKRQCLYATDGVPRKIKMRTLSHMVKTDSFNKWPTPCNRLSLPIRHHVFRHHHTSLT